MAHVYSKDTPDTHVNTGSDSVLLV